MEDKIISYKGMDSKMQCRGMQYEVGKEFSVDGDIECCGNGLHACERPLDVFGYYAPETVAQLPPETVAQLPPETVAQLHRAGARPLAQMALRVRAVTHLWQGAAWALCWCSLKNHRTAITSRTGKPLKSMAKR